MTGNSWDYPTQSDNIPSNDLVNPDPGNNANFYQSGYTIGSPYWTTDVGEFENSESGYGTYDQGGNIFEWNETVINYLPARLSYANITSGSVALTNMTFHIHTSYDPLTTMHLLTQNISGSIYGSAIELSRVHGSTEGPYPWSKEIRSLQAKDNIGILVNAGEYVVFDSAFECKRIRSSVRLSVRARTWYT